MLENKNLLAQVGATDLKGLITGIIDTIVGYIVPLIIALALMFFLWGIFKTVTAAGDEKKRSEGIGYITYGLIGLAVMVSVWGLVSILTSSFFSGPIAIPQLN